MDYLFSFSQWPVRVQNCMISLELHKTVGNATVIDKTGE